MADSRGAVAAALNEERGAHFLDEVRPVVRGRAIDADADPNAGIVI
jgi:hypothetical protein